MVNVGGKGAGVVAFDAASGKVLWQASTDEASYSSPVVADINGQRTAVFFTRNGLWRWIRHPVRSAYQLRWRSRQAASVNSATPIVFKDQIFLSASYSTGAILLQVANNAVKPIWSGEESMSNHYSTSVLKDGYLYGFDGRQEFGQTLRCVEFATGKVMWNVDGFGAGSLLVADNTLVIMRESGELAFASASPKAFAFRSRAQLLPGVVRAYPALSDGRLYVRNINQLAAFDLRAEK